MSMQNSIFFALDEYISGKKSWSEFAAVFSSVYFDKKNEDEVNSLPDTIANLFGEINDCIEFTDEFSPKSERIKYGLMNSEDVAQKILSILKRYENQGWSWKVKP